MDVYDAMLTYAKECGNNYVWTIIGAHPIRTVEQHVKSTNISARWVPSVWPPWARNRGDRASEVVFFFFFGSVSALCWAVPLLPDRCPFSRSHWDHMDPSQFSPGLRRAPESARALSHLSTEDQRAPRRLQAHSCCAGQSLLPCSPPHRLPSAHVFPRLTTNPPIMCIIASREPRGVTALETLTRVVVS